MLRRTIPSPTGKKTCKKYGRVFTADGEAKLECLGEVDFYKAIQISGSGCTVSAIYARSLLGDDTDYQADPSTFVDITAAPKSFMESQNQICRAKAQFEKLPLSIRNEYGNNLSKWLNSVSDGSFFKRYAASDVSDTNISPISEDALTAKIKATLNSLNLGGDVNA